MRDGDEDTRRAVNGKMWPRLQEATGSGGGGGRTETGSFPASVIESRNCTVTFNPFFAERGGVKSLIFIHVPSGIRK